MNSVLALVDLALEEDPEQGLFSVVAATCPVTSNASIGC